MWNTGGGIPFNCPRGTRPLQKRRIESLFVTFEDRVRRTGDEFQTAHEQKQDHRDGHLEELDWFRGRKHMFDWS